MDRRIQRRFDEVAEKYRVLSQGYPEALEQIALAELAESVWQSNAIENSTLQLDDTERVLSGKPPKGEHSLREIYEARNLATLTEELLWSTEPLTFQTILKWHGMLLIGIRDDVAGKLRHAGEWVRGAVAGNKAKRQTIPAFRLRNRWMIAEDYLESDSHRTA